jgi:hypothetical protein
MALEGEKYHAACASIIAWCHEYRTKCWGDRPVLVVLGLSAEELDFARRVLQIWYECRLFYAPTAADAEHSVLLPRLLEGRPFYPFKPPLFMSYPWYDAIEQDEVGTGFENVREANLHVKEDSPCWKAPHHRYGPWLSIGQCDDYVWYDALKRIVLHVDSGLKWEVVETDSTERPGEKCQTLKRLFDQPLGLYP